MSVEIACIGSNIESMICIERLLQSGANITGLLTLPYQEEVRGSDYRNLLPIANKNNIPAICTASANHKDAKQFLQSIHPDFLFILGWSEILDNELVSIPRQLTIGSHPSKLPYGAGRAPVPWTILEGLTESAVSFFRITDQIDAGDLYLQKEFKIPSSCTASQLYSLVADILADGFVEIVQKAKNGNLKSTQQKKGKRTVRARRSYEDGFIDFNQPSFEIDRLIRAITDPFPGAFTFYENETVTIWQSEIEEYPTHKGVPGQVLKKEADRLLVQCLDKPLWIKDLSTSSGGFPIERVVLGSKFGLNLAAEIIKLRERLQALEEK